MNITCQRILKMMHFTDPSFQQTKYKEVSKDNLYDMAMPSECFLLPSLVSVLEEINAEEDGSLFWE